MDAGAAGGVELHAVARGHPMHARVDGVRRRDRMEVQVVEEGLRVDRRIAAGQIVGAYRLVSPLGQGGMGSVWLARDNKLGRKVAIKVLNTQNPELAKRFVVEARATARCGHETERGDDAGVHLRVGQPAPRLGDDIVTET